MGPRTRQENKSTNVVLKRNGDIYVFICIQYLLTLIFWELHNSDFKLMIRVLGHSLSVYRPNQTPSQVYKLMHHGWI